MIVDLLSCIALTTTAVLLFRTTLTVLLRFPDCNLDDVFHSVRPVDLDRLESLLNPANEWQLRANLSKREFRLQQRKRIHETLEIMLRLSHNATVLGEWGHNKSKDGEQPLPARELHEAAVELRVCTLFAIVKLKTWMILRAEAWPFLRPRLSTLRKSAGVDVLFAYLKVRDAAAHLCLDTRPEDFDELLRRL